jgi:hypothetical protein
MRLHVLTAVSRPENLGRVAESLYEAQKYSSDINVIWHWKLDLERQHVGGQYLKNEMLDTFDDGWVWILDDDTLAHPDVFEVVVSARPGVDAVVVSQLRTDGRVLTAGSTELGFIDAGQAFIKRQWIGDRRIPLDYNGDCYWLQEVLAAAEVAWLPDVVSLHNAISGVDVSR